MENTINYYVLLGIPRDANEEQIKSAYDKHMEKVENINDFDLYVEAYRTLSNEYSRERYNKILGYSLAIIQPNVANYPHSLNYVISAYNPSQGFSVLVEKFKDWLLENQNLEWLDAQAMSYNQEFVTVKDIIYLLLRFPNEKHLQEFAQYLVREKLVKNK